MIECERSSKKYAKISIKRRNQLIDFVLTQGKGVAQAAKRLNIKLSTAKHIVKMYQQNKYVYNKKMSKRQQSKDDNSKQPYQEQKEKKEDRIKEQDQDQVKVETKSEGSEEGQVSIESQNYYLVYLFFQFAGIPFCFFYTKIQF